MHSEGTLHGERETATLEDVMRAHSEYLAGVQRNFSVFVVNHRHVKRSFPVFNLIYQEDYDILWLFIGDRPFKYCIQM